MKVKGSDKKSDPFIECKLMSAVEGSRTLIQVIGHEPESCAYTNSATTAKLIKSTKDIISKAINKVNGKEKKQLKIRRICN